MLEIYWTLCLKSLNFSFYLLLFHFANYDQGFDFGLLQWFSFKNFAREIGARATRIYAFAHARAVDRGEVHRICVYNLTTWKVRASPGF